jgi:guanosine-3',5'-bis(diphosphate) 3'-pyrophosphohydrolase
VVPGAGPNGYQSLHTSVVSDRGFPFEVQVRTEDMHRVAEEGIAAHWKYKEGRVGAQQDEQYFRWLRQLLEWQQEVKDPQEFIQNLKIDLYPEEVYCFTPRGEVKSLPKGATPVDFAYMVHTDVGHACVGARINGKMVPLRQRLKNGDIVEIMTQAGHKPSRDWLSLAVTSRARNKIKHFLHHEEKARSIDLGRKLFEREARRFDVNLKTVLDTTALTKAANDSGLPRIDDLFAAIGYGRIAPRQALLRIVPSDDLKEKAPDSALTSAVKRVFKADADKIKVRGADDLLVFRARCCNPIRGEKIVGYITRGKGVSVHASTCSNVTSLLYDPDRRYRPVDQPGRGPEGDTRRSVLEGGGHQHQHQDDGSHHRRAGRPDRHDGRDQRPQAPREGDQVAPRRRWRPQRRALHPLTFFPVLIRVAANSGQTRIGQKFCPA